MKDHLKRMNWDAGIKAAVVLDAAFQNVEIRYKKEYETSGNKTMRADNVLFFPGSCSKEPDSIFHWTKKHSVIEGKYNGSTLNMKTFWKLQEYGCRLLAQPDQTEGIPLPDQTTVIFIKEGYPRRLIKEIIKLTGKKGIEKKGEGIYRVDKLKFAGDTFVAVTDRLNGNVHPFLRCISKRVSASDLERMFSEAVSCMKRGSNIEDLHTVISFAISANRKEYEKMGRRKTEVMTLEEMDEVVMDILKEPVQKRINEAVKEKDNEIENKNNVIKNKDSIIKNQEKEFRQCMRSFAKVFGVDGVIDALKKANPEFTSADLKRIRNLIM